MRVQPRHLLSSLAVASLAVTLCAFPIARGGAADDSIAQNGTFEASQTANWPTGWGHPKTGTWAEENGNHFVRISPSVPGEMDMLYQQFRLPPDCKALELDWRERVTGLKIGAKPWFDARVLVSFKDAAGKDLPDKPGPSATGRDTAGWETRKMQFLVPDGAATMVFMAGIFQAAAGTFDLDDVALRPIDAQPIITAAQTALAAAVEASKKAFVPQEQPQPDKWPKELHVDGNKVVNSAGQPVWLQGVNAGGLESLPKDSHVLKSVTVAIDDWKANIVRLPVKGDFWFGHGPYQKDGGEYYRETVDQAVTLAANRGAYLLLDLHRFRAPEAADVAFWKEAAARYKNNPAVIFDLFNEPHDISWDVWRNGGVTEEKKKGTVDESAFLSADEKAKANAGFQSIGMQTLLETVRAAGARNMVVAGGLSWANDLSGVVNGYALDDKTGDGVMYGWHTYNWHKDWQGHVLGAAAKYPIIVGEVGADVKKMTFIPLQDQEDPSTWVPDMIGFIQKYHLNWTAWCLHPKATPILISDWNYTPTPFWGMPVKEALSGKQFVMQRMR